MKIMLLGDTHLRYRAPVGRTDNFFQTQLDKFDQLLRLYAKYDCGLLLQAGDLFDNPRPPNIVMSTYIARLKAAGIVMYSVLGQHDVAMHNLGSVDRSAFAVLQSAGVLELLGLEPFYGICEGAAIYGASFGQDIPKPNGRAILVTHQMIGDKPLWPSHKLELPPDFVDCNPGYELILCGDYHYRFCQKIGETTIVNPGSLMRMTCSERDREHHPACALYDTESHELFMQELEIQDSDQVFLPVSSGHTATNESVTAFVDRLRAESGDRVSFRDNLKRYFDAEKVDDEVIEMIFRLLDKEKCDG